MKPTPTSATPAMKTINGKQCVRVLDLAKAWGTTTATILATDKPHAVPDRYIHRLDGRAWCELDGLRQRADAVKDRKSSYISREIIDFLDSLEKPAEPKPETQPTDLGTAALIADARRAASQALHRAHEAGNFAYDTYTRAKTNDKRIGKLEIRMDSVEADVYMLNHDERVQELSGKLDRLTDAIHGTQNKTTDNAAAIHVVKQTADTALDTATQAADLAQENADIVSGEIERLTKQGERIDRIEKKAHARHDDTMTRIIQTERNQRDNTARIRTLEEHARAVDWALAAVAVLGVVGRVIRLLHRR